MLLYYNYYISLSLLLLYQLSPLFLANVMQAGLATRWWRESCCKQHAGWSHTPAPNALTNSLQCAQSNRWCMMSTLDRRSLCPGLQEAQRLMEWTLCSWLTHPLMMIQQLWVSIFSLAHHGLKSDIIIITIITFITFSLKVARRDVANPGTFCCMCMQPDASSLCLESVLGWPKV